MNSFYFPQLCIFALCFRDYASVMKRLAASCLEFRGKVECNSFGLLN